jgi:acyl-CoA synthetase (AMP-forming)/AMP-acid ligase II
MAGQTRSYAAVQRFSWLVGRALARSGVQPGDAVAVLAGNDPMAFGCAFGISRAGAVWCPLSLQGQPADYLELLELLDCRALIFSPAFASQVAWIAPGLPELAMLVCLDSGDAHAGIPGAVGFGEWVSGLRDDPWQADPASDVVLVARAGGTDGGTDGATIGGTAGGPGGTRLTGRDIAAMTARTLISYPFRSRPVYLALALLSHEAGLLSLPVMTLGGEVVIMASDPDLAAGIEDIPGLIGKLRVTHAYLPTAVICQLLDHPDLPAADLSSLQGLWYGDAPLPAARLEQAVRMLGLVPRQLVTEASVPGLPADTIITGGLDVDCGEVEQSLLAHPAVLDCAVVGLPDGRWGERVTAVIQAQPGQEVELDELARFVRDALGNVKAPKKVEIWPDLPRSRAGTVLKAEVRSRLLRRDG